MLNKRIKNELKECDLFSFRETTKIVQSYILSTYAIKFIQKIMPIMGKKSISLCEAVRPFIKGVFTREIISIKCTLSGPTSQHGFSC